MGACASPGKVKTGGASTHCGMCLMRWVFVHFSRLAAAAKRMRWVVLPLACVVLTGCANLSGDSTAGRSPEADLQPFALRLLSTPASEPAWEMFALPGKRSAPFEASTVMGRPALRVRADRSVSILRQRFANPAVNVGQLNFSWKIDSLPIGADMRDAQTEDSPVRVVVRAFSVKGTPTRNMP